MTQDNDEPSVQEQLQAAVEAMSEDDNFLLVIQGDVDEEGAEYQALTSGDYDTVVNAAIVALTLAGKDIIAQSGEDPDAPGMDAKAFFYGLKVMSRTAEQWAESIKAAQEEGDGPKHVKETIEDSAGSGDATGGNPPRTAHDGSSVH